MIFTVSDMFSDHMVLRHSRPAPIWGTAPAFAELTAFFCGAKAHCFANAQGHWQLWLTMPKAGTCGTLTIQCAGESISFEDVVTGVVFLCGGQSNMEQPVMCAQDGKYWANHADMDNVRLKFIPRRCTPETQPGWHFYPCFLEDGPWVRADRDHAAVFSAIGYIFGAKLAKAMNMPVGLIDCNWGGTKIQCWLPTEELLAHPDTVEDLNKYQAVRESLGDKAHTALQEYIDTIEAALVHVPNYIDRSLEDPLDFLIEDKNIRFVPEGADGSPEKPGVLFDHMITHVMPFGLNGVLWYQGEANSNENEAPRYVGLFGRLLTAWRNAFQDDSLPFLTCQLASFEASMYPGISAFPAMREQQQFCTDLYKNVSMAVLLDVGMRRNIHPLRKEPVSDRLCRLALEDIFHIPTNAHAAHPIAWSLLPNGVELRFSKPITLQAGELPLLLHKSDTIGICCTVEQTDSDTLLLRSENGSVLGVEYAYRSWVEPGLFSLNGDPIAPFRIIFPQR